MPYLLALDFRRDYGRLTLEYTCDSFEATQQVRCAVLKEFSALGWEYLGSRTIGPAPITPASLPCGCVRSEGLWISRCVTHQELDTAPDVRAMLDGDC